MPTDEPNADLTAEAANRLRNDVQRDAARSRASEHGNPVVDTQKDAEETESQTRERHHDAF